MNPGWGASFKYCFYVTILTSYFIYLLRCPNQSRNYITLNGVIAEYCITIVYHSKWNNLTQGNVLSF